jgi:DNA-binding XRE family transcriptional regulator
MIVGSNFKELWDDPNFIDDQQRQRIDFEVALVGKMIEARESKGLTQKQLADLVGMKQPAIARLESLKVVPRVDTLIKILSPLGYTIKIVPKE